MRTLSIVLSLAVLFTVFWLWGTRVKAQENLPIASPVVLELFTSQGCSSCPPADALLAKLASEPGVLVLSRPVTYWDDLGWKDTLAREENTRKQRAYQSSLEGRRGVYTPQVVVDGRWGWVGSDERNIRRAIAQNRAAEAEISVTTANGKASIRVSGGAGAEVLLIGYTPRAEVPIGRGENTGRRIIYTNVVRTERRLGKASGAETRFEVDQPQSQDDTAFVVLVQQGAAGPILAAAAL